MATQSVIMSHTSFPVSFGRLLSPLSGVAILAPTSHLKNACKKVKRVEEIWTEETLRALRRAQMPEMGKCRLCQRPTETIKDLVQSGANEG